MTAWTDGYVSDLDYTIGFYREMSPTLLAMAARMRGLRAPEPEGPLAYCELGSGQGFTANLLAAANPNLDIYATDFMPAHTANARRLAREAGVDNVQFFEQSFQEFLDEPSLPPFDIIVLHGIYSWVTAENRAAIVEFLRRKLKPGGLVYVSYNTVAWGPSMPMREVMYRYGKSRAGSSSQRMTASLQLMDRLIEANAGYFTANPHLPAKFERTKKMPLSYLAHEYFNAAWTLLYHEDVAGEFAEAKLSFVGSAHLLDHIEALNLSPEQQQLLAELGPGPLHETVKDFITAQQFRRDVFIKGVSAIAPGELTESWAGQRFILSAAPSAISLKLAVPRGEVSLQADYYQPLIAALATGPKTVAELLEAPEFAAKGFGELLPALAILVGLGHAQPCLGEEARAEREARTERFNQAVLERARWSADLGFLASPVTGAGVMVDRLSQLFLLARSRGAPDLVDFVAKALRAAGHSVIKDGVALEKPEETIAELRARHARLQETELPVLQRLGIA